MTKPTYRAETGYPAPQLTTSGRAPLLTLPADVAERIAAGEVIERPVSVVKELVENALDAGARDVRVEVRGGGLLLVRVFDDGCGIPAEELEHVCQRHTTSKIRTYEDLERLHTLVFRGEALASIAAVAEVNLLSRAVETAEQGEEQPAYFVTLRGGTVIERGRRARLPGTTITVRDLFYNVPARLKFIRKERTENSYIVQLLQRYAAGYPAVRFTLTVDDRTLLQTGGSGDLARALAELYHLPLNEMLHPINVSERDCCNIHGYIGNRVLAQSSRQYLMLFVNGRPVHSRPLLDALEQGYRNLLPKGKHPLLALSLEVPSEEVDANVHPAKTEVRLTREGEVTAALAQAVRAVLERSPALPNEVRFPGPALLTQHRLPGPRRRGLHIAETADGYRADSAEPGNAEVIARLRPLAQLQQAVILAEAPDGSLYLVDQHRAHERIIYEHLRRTYTGVPANEAADAHMLLEPVMIEMKRYQADLLEQRLPMLRGLGLECERFGGRSFLIRSVPAGEGYEQLAAHLQDLAEIAAEDSPDWEDHLLIGLACRSAMRRGRELGPGEQAALLKALANAAAPAVCPHGSPVLLHYSRAFLIEKFDW
ncbi:MAG: DNA mismatch repair endonuclease MutL [Ktedonobacteraceae bacterium]|nr:DNA mismatch repair endonuclease MutL [Ktedonobacteraceae bacterium]